LNRRGNPTENKIDWEHMWDAARNSKPGDADIQEKPSTARGESCREKSDKRERGSQEKPSEKNIKVGEKRMR